MSRVTIVKMTDTAVKAFAPVTDGLTVGREATRKAHLLGAQVASANIGKATATAFADAMTRTVGAGLTTSEAKRMITVGKNVNRAIKTDGAHIDGLTWATIIGGTVGISVIHDRLTGKVLDGPTRARRTVLRQLVKGTLKVTQGAKVKVEKTDHDPDEKESREPRGETDVEKGPETPREILQRINTATAKLETTLGSWDVTDADVTEAQASLAKLETQVADMIAMLASTKAELTNA